MKINKLNNILIFFPISGNAFVLAVFQAKRKSGWSQGSNKFYLSLMQECLS
jgi:hypothetical protein